MNYLDIFHEICSIPRPSHHEEAIADYLCNFAKSHGLEYHRDPHNCVVIRKAASSGYESHEPVCILNHMDMVCVADPGYEVPGPVTPIIYDKPASPQLMTHDSERWMKADHTSLGADNGIGLSMALAILADGTTESPSGLESHDRLNSGHFSSQDKSSGSPAILHPALEVLTTTCEEDDMSGASNLAPDFIHSRKVLNLDSEAYDEITVASAGAHIQLAHLPLSRVSMPKDYITFDITVDGGKGGHSGVDINQKRANTIKILSNFLLVAIRQLNIKLYLVNFNGGQAYSAIPAEASARVIIPKDDMEAFATLLEQCQGAIRQQYSETDPDVEITAQPSIWHSTVLSEESTHVFLASINAIPSGVVQYKDDGESAYTSNNIGLVRMTKDSVTVSTHTRSFSDKAMADLADNISKIFSLAGAEMSTVMHVGAWVEDAGHPWIRQGIDTFKSVLGFAPTPVSMHFALEAGYYVEKFPGIHIVSIGPRIISPHSANEHVSLTTADNIWKVVTELLKNS